MKALRPPRPDLEDLEPYEAREPEVAVNLAANENPSNLPHEVLEKLSERLPDVAFNRYPDPMANGLRRLIAEANGLEPGNVIVGNGGDELVFDLLLAWGGPGRTLLTLPPTFAMYEIDARLTGTRLIEVPRRADFSADEAAVLSRLGEGDVDCVFIAHPNNPTGNLHPETFLIDVLKATDALVLVDEAYFEFSRHTMRPHMGRHKNLVILRTFSKAFSLAGLRIGYLLAHEDVVRELTKVRQPYSVDRFSQWVAATVFRERVTFESQISDLIRERDVIVHGLDRLDGVEVFPTEANFVLFRVEHAPAVWRDLLRGHGVLVRDLSRVPALEDCLRVSVGTPSENQAFLEAMSEIVSSRRAASFFGTTNGAPYSAEGQEPEASHDPGHEVEPRD